MKQNYLHIILTCVFLVIYNTSFAQNEFELSYPKEKQKVSFEMYENLIIIPVKVNGHKLHFLLDSDLNYTTVFHSKKTKFLINNIKNKNHLSSATPTNFVSKNNQIELKKIVANNQNILVVEKNKENPILSKIDGIIGYDLLKNFVIEINYTTQKMVFYNPDYYRYKFCRKCSSFKLNFIDKKPYMAGNIKSYEMTRNSSIELSLLVDIGNNSSLWLHENENNYLFNRKIAYEDKNFTIDHLLIGDIKIKHPTTVIHHSVNQLKQKNGRIGGKMLRQFHIILDYPNKMITLRKNNVSLPENDLVISNKNQLHFKNQMNEIVVLANENEEIIDEKETISNFEEKFYYPNEIQQLKSSKKNKKIKLIVEKDGKQQEIEVTLKDIR
ncbi:retropepsin-like aspartic protease [Aureivirga marina]|uniref:retropepsin-like aspartic protease n=1 Tax=Aureivirga marina TaxID=1182451 RepID=UPI0018C957AB|nr:retropepsin-like aspartic protease [Aureivirga marina]